MIAPILALCASVLQSDQTAWQPGPALPTPVSNNAVAALMTPDGPAVFSFLGLDATKRWDGIVARSFRWTVGDTVWTELRPVPGPGRLAATAEGWRNRVFLFGGYTVARNGSEKSVPNVDIYDPATDRWSRGSDIPVAVDDAVSGVWRDSLIYLISGWHDTGNVADVQIYDPARDTWTAATPIPGTPVFGHAGVIVENAIVYIDGVRVNPGRPRFTMEGASWRGDIDPSDPTRVTWTRLPDHPGPALYRAAGGVVGNWVLFAAGTDNPYNYNGVGYNSVPAEPRAAMLGYDMNTGAWHSFPPLPRESMDHRRLVTAGDLLVLVGGMEQHQTVSDGVLLAPVAEAMAPRPRH